MRNQIEYSLKGRYALFTDPITRVGGEKCSYQIPTYQALKGITESIYWKPSIIWYIDSVRIMNPIRTESKNVRPVNFDGSNTLSIYTYLSDVEYRVRAHFEFNLNRPEAEPDRDENKHHNIAKRMVQRGGRRDIFLGTRECQGYVEPADFDAGSGFYDNYGELSFGLMFYGFDYPDESGRNDLGVKLWTAKMENGIIKFPRPEEFGEDNERYRLRIVRADVEKKQFIHGENMAYVDECRELKGICEEVIS